MPLYRYPFAVVDDPHCVVDHDLDERNRQFLASIDAGYFQYVTRVHEPCLETDDRQRAAIAIRTTYHHGVETLFAFLGAYIQAPAAVVAWIPRSWPFHLRDLAERLQVGRALLTQTGPRRLLFHDLSQEVHTGAWQDRADREALVAGFARVWSRLASDLCDPLLQAEYNSIKHGFRVRAGGFTLRVGRQAAPGVPAPPDAMRTLGSSTYGTSFYSPVGRDGTPATRSTLELRVRRQALNWHIDRVRSTIPLIAMSIHNVVSRLRLLNGVPSEELSIQQCPIQDFDAPLRYSPGVTSSNMDIDVPWEDVLPSSREDLLREINAAGAA